MESQTFITETAGFGKNIGEDVVEEILSMLPPKTLMRFKCVSKNWYALIISPRFIAKHLSKSLHKTPSVLLKHIVQKDTDADETEDVFSLLNFRNDGGDEHSSLASFEDVKIPLPMSLKTMGDSLCILGHCNGIIFLVMANTCEVLLWNPAIKELKLLPTLPHLPESPEMVSWVTDTLGFGYDPKSNNYKVMNVYSGSYDFQHSEAEAEAQIELCIPPVVAIYSLCTDSWREAKTYSLETQTTLLQPMMFQTYFQGMCYWFGHERYKEINIYDSMYEQCIREVIILFDVGYEVFDAMVFPVDSLEYNWVTLQRLLVWNESIAYFGIDSCDSFGIWIMDEFGRKGTWTKLYTLELKEKPLAFLKSDEILMAYEKGCVFSYNLGTKNLNNLPIQRVASDSAAVAYVESIVLLLGSNKPETGDISASADVSAVNYSQISHSIPDHERYSYSVWAIPPNDVSLRIKSIMDGLREEFGGPEIEPHIPVVGSIRMTHEEVLSKFRSLQSQIIYSYKAKVEQVVTRNFYYQCVSLLIDASTDDASEELSHASGTCRFHFDFNLVHRPRLSLLCGNLTGEERKIAQEKVSIMDESITSLSFPITRLALYKINYQDATLKSWVKIEEYPLLFNQYHG